MKKKQCIAMLLAGGQGSRLGRLTTNIAKPAVSFGGKYRIIDFGLSNCVNSGIDTVGILVQYKPLILNRYVGTGESWDLAVADGGVHVLPPYAGETGDGTSRSDLLRVLAALESLEGRRKRLFNWFQYYDGKLGLALEDYRLTMLKNYVSQQARELAALRERARTVPEAYYEPVTVRELLHSRLAYLEHFDQELSDLLSRTREL